MTAVLTDANAKTARHIIVAASNALLAAPEQVHYTKDLEVRWDAIRREVTVHGGHLLPFTSDCSGTASWLLWLALHHSFGVRDVVNDLGWRAGYTGTMVKHGESVDPLRGGKIGDCIFYGGTRQIPGHVAVKVAPGHVFSHGSERGPFFLPTDYRTDIMGARRYF